MASGHRDDVATTVQILDVAERLVQTNGYNGFSYADVASELKITRAALHYHFRGKAELGEALITRYADRFATALADLDAGGADGLGKLDGYAELYADVLRGHRMCLCGMLAAEHQTLPPAMQRAVVAFFDHNTTWLERALEQGGRDGTLRFAGSVQDTALMILASLEGAMLVTRWDGGPARFQAAAARLLASLATPDRTPPDPATAPAWESMGAAGAHP